MEERLGVPGRDAEPSGVEPAISMSKVQDSPNGRNNEEAQLDPTRAVKAVRDARRFSFEDFRSPDDGRQWKSVAGQRRSYFIEIASYADSDGTNAFPSIESLQRILGDSRRTVFRRLAELKELGFIRDVGKSKYQGTTIREVLLPTSNENPEMTLPELRKLRARRQKQERDGQLRPAKDNDPGGYQEWEQCSRSEYPELWKMLDAET